MTTFVLVPGMWHGGWSYRPVTDRLRQRGHEVHPLTLTGLSERSHLLGASVNLKTHIADVVGVLETYDLSEVVLVGHSYGGMVITGAADRTPDRVRALVYLDAVVPADGDSQWGLVSDRERDWYQDIDDEGYGVKPLSFLDPRATSHPVASLFQPLRLTTDLRHVERRHYAYATNWNGPSPFTSVFHTLQNDADWTVHEVDSGHNVMGEAPDRCVQILVQAAGAGIAPTDPGGS